MKKRGYRLKVNPLPSKQKIWVRLPLSAFTIQLFLRKIKLKYSQKTLSLLLKIIFNRK